MLFLSAPSTQSLRSLMKSLALESTCLITCWRYIMLGKAGILLTSFLTIILFWILLLLYSITELP